MQFKAAIAKCTSVYKIFHIRYIKVFDVLYVISVTAVNAKSTFQNRWLDHAIVETEAGMLKQGTQPKCFFRGASMR